MVIGPKFYLTSFSIKVPLKSSPFENFTFYLRLYVSSQWSFLSTSWKMNGARVLHEANSQGDKQASEIVGIKDKRRTMRK